MTHFEAFNKVENALLDLGLIDQGQALLPAQVAGVLSNTFGPEWTSVEDALRSDSISPDEYCVELLRLIDAFRKRRFHQRMATNLERLAQRQSEVGVT